MLQAINQALGLAESNLDKNMATVLIADDFEHSLLSGLTNAGVEYIYLPSATREQILQHLKTGIEGLLLRSKTPVDKELLDTGNLKWVGRGGAGMDTIDEIYATQKGITCFNAGEANSVAVAEHALGLLLGLIRNIRLSDHEVRNGIWLREENRGLELSSLTVGVIGFGNTGSAFAHRLALLGCKVLAYDKYKTNFRNETIQECELKEIYENADVLSLHIPLTKETTYLVNSEFISNFKKPIFLLNTSRGKIVCLNSVIEQFAEGKIRGFGADVLENETFKTFGEKELSTFELVKAQKNVILTPHIAGWTEESYRKISEVLLEKVLKCLTKKNEK